MRSLWSSPREDRVPRKACLWGGKSLRGENPKRVSVFCLTLIIWAKDADTHREKPCSGANRRRQRRINILSRRSGLNPRRFTAEGKGCGDEEFCLLTTRGERSSKELITLWVEKTLKGKTPGTGLA